MRAHGVFVGGTHVQNAKTKEPFFSLDLVDADLGGDADAESAGAARTRRIPLTFLAHGFTVRPGQPNVAAVFEKKGPGGALVDLAEGTRLRAIDPLPGCAFYGHGQYGEGGDVLYCVESELATRRGLLTVRDATDFRVLEEVPTFGQSPHDCVFVDAHTLVVTNGGGPIDSSEPGCVTIVDVKARKLVERLDVTDGRINAGHLAVRDAGTFAVSSAPRDGLPATTSSGGVSFRWSGGAFARASAGDDVTARMLGESLSVALDRRSDVAVVTNPWGDLLTRWDAREARLLEARSMEFVRGVAMTLDGAHFVLAHGKMPTLSLFTADGLRPVRSVATGVVSGSHVYVWAPPG
ncbi:MAG: DUF1513 domain-containing protein [Polyangiaceae bacterium]